MPVLKTDADDKLKRAFKRRAKAKGLSESELLRRIVLQELGADSEIHEPATGEGEDATLKRMTVRIPAFLEKPMDRRATQKGMKASRWVSALVQSNLMADPVSTDREVEVLRAVNRELAAVGRNVNQIAKHLNTAFYENERVNLDALARTPKLIEAVQLAVRRLVRASKQGWAVDEQL